MCNILTAENPLFLLYKARLLLREAEESLEATAAVIPQPKLHRPNIILVSYYFLSQCGRFPEAL